ncbi:hypothetical protein F511_28795 [Dorcoceras hygrometricum]|uniref:Uncharacterized protein n=1 Tax=Dorcoceras hygrometricum TaxID=472368 RepID=A0A2Z7DFR9_9LAMI|nr:hypothetical protein F511_28795 [Dorcoceras hygrometricum]
MVEALLSSQAKLKSVKNHLPKAVKEQKNYWSTVAKTYEHCNNFALQKSADSSLQTDCGRYRQSGPRPDTRLLRHPALEGVMRSARTDSPRRIGRKQFSGEEEAVTAMARGGGGGGGSLREEGAAT